MSDGSHERAAYRDGYRRGKEVGLSEAGVAGEMAELRVQIERARARIAELESQSGA